MKIFTSVLLILFILGVEGNPAEDVLLAGGGGGGNATGAVHDHASIMHDLTTLSFIWAGVYLCNLISHYVGLTAIVFWVLFGALCVNTGLLPEHPSPFMATFSELAITLVMFALGLEEDVRHFLEGIKKAWGIALIGAMGPFSCGFILCYIYFGDLKVATMGG
jgi:Kef-type K+ transport system membrane component KefB